MEAGRCLRPVDPLHQRLQQDLVDQGRLARPGDAGDRHETTERNLDVDVAEVVFACASNDQALLARYPATAGTGIDFFPDR